MMSRGNKWSSNEDAQLRQGVASLGSRRWKEIARTYVPTRTATQCRQRWYNQLQPDIRKGTWSVEENNMFQKAVNKYGHHNWPTVAAAVPHRTPKQCREHWARHFNPLIDHGPFTPKDDETLMRMIAQGHGNAHIGRHLSTFRTADQVKTRYRTLTCASSSRVQPAAKKRRLSPLVDDVQVDGNVQVDDDVQVDDVVQVDDDVQVDDVSQSCFRDNRQRPQPNPRQHAVCPLDILVPTHINQLFRPPAPQPVDISQLATSQLATPQHQHVFNPSTTTVVW